MWFSLKKSLADQGVFHSFTDNHSHILPGVDDGVKTMDDALTILSAYEKCGMTEVWLTPHIQEFIPNTTQHLQERYAELKSAYTGALTLHLAAEYMLDNVFIERFETKDLLLHSLSGTALTHRDVILQSSHPILGDDSGRLVCWHTSYLSPS